MSFISIFALLLFALPLQSDHWLQNEKEARELAQKEGKDLLLAVVGPGWCPWSDKLAVDVLSNQEFIESLSRDFVLLKIDFPNRSSELKLKETYQIENCPQFVIIQASGSEVTKVGYLPLKPKEYANYITGLLNDFKFLKQVNLKNLPLEEIKEIYTKAKRLGNQKIKDSIIHAGVKVDQSTFFLLEQYGSLISKGKVKSSKLDAIRSAILERDPKNQEGSLLKVALLDFERLSHPQAKKTSPEEVVQPLVQYLAQHGAEDKENLWKVEMKISHYLFGKNQLKEALKYARSSLDVAPENAKPEIKETIQFLQTYIE